MCDQRMKLRASGLAGSIFTVTDTSLALPYISVRSQPHQLIHNPIPERAVFHKQLGNPPKNKGMWLPNKLLRGQALVTRI